MPKVSFMPHPNLSVHDFVFSAFNHKETGRVPLWGIIQNRPVYEYMLGKDRVGDGADVALDDKLRLHAEVYSKLGIDITRAQIWPPDRKSAKKGGTDWAERLFTSKNITEFHPTFPSEKDSDADVGIRARQVEINRAHTVFAPTIRGVLCPVYEAMGLEEFSYALTDSLKEVERLMDDHRMHARSLAERYAARPGISIVAIVDDLAYKGATVVAPKWLRKHWLPRLKDVIQPLKQKGIKVIYHSDGKIDSIIEDLIGIGIDGINPLEPLAGMDLVDLKKRFGSHVTLIGGVDCSQLLPFGKPEQIKNEVKRLLDIGAPGGGFIIGDSSNVLVETPVDNLLAFYETVHQYSGG
jgi:hypothetical protein